MTLGLAFFFRRLVCTVKCANISTKAERSCSYFDSVIAALGMSDKFPCSRVDRIVKICYAPYITDKFLLLSHVASAHFRFMIARCLESQTQEVRA